MPGLLSERLERVTHEPWLPGHLHHGVPVAVGDRLVRVRLAAVDATSRAHGDATGKILFVCTVKEELRALLTTACTGGQRHDTAHRLDRSDSWGARSDLPELERLAATIEAWWPEVRGSRQTGRRDQGDEATNRTSKTTAHTAYDFRRVNNQRRCHAAEQGSPATPAPADHRPAEGRCPHKLEEPV